MHVMQEWFFFFLYMDGHSSHLPWLNHGCKIECLQFCRANMFDLNVLQNILALYEQTSGQQINRDKTNIFFSKAMEEERKSEIIDFFGMTDVKEYMKYPGLPAVVGRNKKASLNYIKEQVWSKLQGGRRSYYPRERVLTQSDGSSYSNIYYEFLQITHWPMLWDWVPN